MLTPERYGDLEYATVPVDRRAEAIESMKAALPDRERCCTECGYEAPTRRWGIKIYGTSDPSVDALVLCCPSCERHVDLPIDLE
jgi:hypothetical protein